MKSNVRRFETYENFFNMLNTMTFYNLPADFVKREEVYVKGLTVEKQLELVNKHTDPSRMYYCG